MVSYYNRPDGIQVVAIVTPNHLHVPIAKTFAEKSVNIKGLPANVQNELKKVEFLSDSLKSLNPNLNVAIDLLDVKDFSYYSNITFDIAIPGSNQIVDSGGRYNELIKTSKRTRSLDLYPINWYSIEA